MQSPPSDRLNSWKEIAEYLGKAVTTVRRWEREEGLPVRRLEHHKRGTIVAFRAELDTWLASRTTPLPIEPEGEEPAAAATLPLPERESGVEQVAVIRRRPGWILAAVAATLATAALIVARHPPAQRLELMSIALTSDPGLEGGPGLSPDGQRVAYDDSAPGQEGIYIRSIQNRAGECHSGLRSPVLVNAMCFLAGRRTVGGSSLPGGAPDGWT